LASLSPEGRRDALREIIRRDAGLVGPLKNAGLLEAFVDVLG
jgi:hypothetical protein